MTTPDPAPENCPDPSGHGTPFRYCPYCSWRESPANEAPDVTNAEIAERLEAVETRLAEILAQVTNIANVAGPVIEDLRKSPIAKMMGI